MIKCVCFLFVVVGLAVALPIEKFDENQSQSSDLNVQNTAESIEDVNPIAAASTIAEKKNPLKESNDKDKDKESLVPAEHFWGGYNGYGGWGGYGGGWGGYGGGYGGYRSYGGYGNYGYGGYGYGPTVIYI